MKHLRVHLIESDPLRRLGLESLLMRVGARAVTGKADVVVSTSTTQPPHMRGVPVIMLLEPIAMADVRSAGLPPSTHMMPLTQAPKMLPMLLQRHKNQKRKERWEKPNTPLATLTPRERQVLSLVAQGLSNQEIATRTDTTEGTVKVHLRAIMKKLNLTNRTQVALFALSHV
jgi:RNA polymerase sigma factor (sigma-70 family)